MTEDHRTRRMADRGLQRRTTTSAALLRSCEENESCWARGCHCCQTRRRTALAPHLSANQLRWTHARSEPRHRHPPQAGRCSRTQAHPELSASPTFFSAPHLVRTYGRHQATATTACERALHRAMMYVQQGTAPRCWISDAISAIRCRSYCNLAILQYCNQ